MQTRNNSDLIRQNLENKQRKNDLEIKPKA